VGEPTAPTAGPKVAICAIARNEAAYLGEWIGYHRLLGFDPIRVYSHESTDDSNALLERLAGQGLVEWTPWTAPPDKKPQWVAYEDGLEQLRGRADWVALIDLDEFIVLSRHRTIQEFLAEYGDLGAIAMNWKMFGSGGQERHEPGLVIERFTRCARRRYSGNKAIKTLARVDDIEVPRVHTCHFRPGVSYRTVIGEEIPPATGKSRTVTHDIIRVNHYFTRSREEWQAKATRGRGAKPANHPKKHRTEAEFLQNDRNEEEDLELLAFADGVKAFIARHDAGGRAAPAVS
jgi:hypothetical protein